MVFIQAQINKIRNSLKDRQPLIAWQIIHYVSKRRRTMIDIVKAPSQEERIRCGKSISRI